jgi:hypothetical protein
LGGGGGGGWGGDAVINLLYVLKAGYYKSTTYHPKHIFICVKTLPIPFEESIQQQKPESSLFSGVAKKYVSLP